MQRRPVLAGMAALAMNGCGSWMEAPNAGRGLAGYIRTNWSRDPFSFGAYSYFTKGISRSEYDELERPIDDRVFFAGEATYPEFNSTVHAAYLAGQRTAEMVRATVAGRVGVIGAGMSGLSAAHSLSAAGREVTVLEARDRIGGRVWTSDALGFPADLGAAWIHGIEGNPLTRLSDEQGIARELTTSDFAVRGSDGRSIPMNDAPSWLLDEAEIQLVYGADKHLIDPSGFVETEGFDGPDVSFPEGYSQIFAALEGGHAVEFGKVVTGVHHSDDGVEIALANRERRAFDCVVVTVPLGVLKAGSIAFDPPLPTAKQNAIDRIGMGLLDKLYLKFDRVFWDREATWIGTPETGMPLGYFNQWFNLSRYIEEPVIVALNGGSAGLALAQEDDAALVDMALATLAGAYPEAST